MKYFYSIFILIDLSNCIPTPQSVKGQLENETNIMKYDVELSVFGNYVSNSTNSTTGCTGEFWQPSSHKGKPVSYKIY